MGDPRILLDRASQLRQAGDLGGAVNLLRGGAAEHADAPTVWNMLGILELELRDSAAAAGSFQRAVDIDPAPPLLLNLARAQRATGDFAGQLESLNRALSADPYYLPAILDKGEALFALGKDEEGLELYRLFFEGLDPNEQFPPPIVARLAAAR